MSITINQYPTSPNMTNNNLLYSVSSTQTAQPQFQFVADLYVSGSEDYVQRVKQQPNPSGYGTFDLGLLMSSQYGPTDEVWKASVATSNTSSAKQFSVLFGEEYGSSVSSSVIQYTGVGVVTGSAAVSASEYYYLPNGVVDPNELTNWNWLSGSYYAEEDATDDITFVYQHGLTTFATASIRLGDYHTISLLNGNTNGAANNATLAQDVFAMTVRQYDSSGVIGSTDTIYNLTLRATDTDDWSSIYTSQTSATRLTHFPVGPANLVDSGIALDSDLSYYTATFNAQATDRTPNEDGIWGVYRFDITSANCGYDGVRFAWKNKLGVWDYYNFSLQSDSDTSIARESYLQNFVDYSSTSTAVAYSKQRRGQKQFYNALTQRKTANSDWLTQAEADNIKELFFSTNVYIQDGTDLLPVVIGSANVVEKSNPRTQKNFQYLIEFQPANQLRPRL